MRNPNQLTDLMKLCLEQASLDSQASALSAQVIVATSLCVDWIWPLIPVC